MTQETISSNSEISIPVADPHDPYAVPALMPSSADNAVRSYKPTDFDIPTRTQEDWRFTPVERLSEFFDVQRTLMSGKTQVSVRAVDNSDISNAVVVRSESEPFEEANRVSKPSDYLSAVAYANASRYMLIEVVESVEQPIIVDITSESLAIDALHLCIYVHDDVRCDIVLRHMGTARLLEDCELLTGDNSNVSFTSIQEWDDNSKHAGNHRIRVGAHATLHHTMVTLGADVVRLRMDQDFAGEEADITMLGMYFVSPNKHIEHRTMVVHNTPHCRSRVIYKGALEGQGAHATWVGNALIQPTAPQTDSYELNRNLILTPGAVADSEPNLEIENGNIVGAGHASSVGRFDDEELFYLMSRGISEAQARQLVVRGFFAELIQEIGIPSICDHVMEVIERRLERIQQES